MDLTTSAHRRRGRRARVLALAAACACATTAPLPRASAVPPSQTTEGGCQYRQLGSIPLRWDGLRPTIAGSIDGQALPMVLDTGAIDTVVSSRLAARLRLPRSAVELDPQVGLGGRSAAVQATVSELAFGRFRWRDVGVVVPEASAPDLPDVLVSAGFLFGYDVEFGPHAVTFFDRVELEPFGCGDEHPPGWASGAPWVPAQPLGPRDRRVTIPVMVGGVELRALVDSGSPLSIVDLAVARRLGFDPAHPDVRPGRAGGIGGQLSTQWIAGFRGVLVGPELVSDARLAVADLAGGETGVSGAGADAAAAPQMILGADFLRAHRVLFATSQHRMYFAYAGGEVFQAMAMTRPVVSSASGAEVPGPAASAPPPRKRRPRSNG